MKNVVFRDVAPYRHYVKWRLGGTYRLHFQGIKIRERESTVSRWMQTSDSICSHLHTLLPSSRLFTLKMEAIRSAETSVYTISTRRQVTEAGIPHIFSKFQNISMTIRLTVIGVNRENKFLLSIFLLRHRLLFVQTPWLQVFVFCQLLRNGNNCFGNRL
jgi:hypothetical protein